MNKEDKVAVCSRSFSRNPVLRAELLERYEHVSFNDEGLKLEGDVLVGFLQNCDKAITALEQIDESVVAQLPKLKVISKYGVGTDMIDFAALEKHNKHFGWTGGVNKRSVSELVISYAIAMLRHIPVAHREVLSGTWRQHVGGLLSDRTLGILGCGHVGKDLVELIQPFNCRILAHDILDFKSFYDRYGVEAVSLDDLLTRSDVLTIHLPLDDSTRGVLSADRLAKMKDDGILINLARGELVDEKALKTQLIEGRLAAAAFDVFAVEPPQDTELLNLPNFLVTPHLGGSAEEAMLAMGRAAITGLDENAIPSMVAQNHN